jgi:phospholipid/cholesterol/gamma-HCH transport system substrate-binding protein
METRANYIITGAFTLAVIFAAFGFVFWFHNSGGVGARAVYRLVFSGSVSGLHTGASVMFNGIRVGDVAQLALDPHDPRKVVALVAIDRAVPVRADTRVALEFQGLTGLAEVGLSGGSADAPVLVAAGGQPPTLIADPSAGADVTQAARDTLSRINGLVAANETALRASLHNIETVSATLAQNSQRLDRVMAGLESLTGSGDNRGEIAQAVEAIRHLAENLDKRTDEISTGLTQFSNSGLKQFEAFAVDGRRTLAELQKVIKNIDQHPSRLIFGQ